MNTGQVLRTPRLWLLPTVIVAAVAVLLPLLYMGGILNPAANLDRLPIGLVNADRGTPTGGPTHHVGAGIAAAITGVPDPEHRIDWQPMTEEQARTKLDAGRLYGVLLIPDGFTASVTALGATASPAAERPTITVLTNPRAGSMASSLAATAAQQAATQASRRLGDQLLAATAAAPKAPLVFGFAVTHLYDRKGLHRLTLHLPTHLPAHRAAADLPAAP
jgi:YhgE/Pip-like protein